jgi:hypothetical protein
VSQNSLEEPTPCLYHLTAPLSFKSQVKSDSSSAIASVKS